MAQIDARADLPQSPIPGRFQRFGAWLDRVLTPTRVAYLFVGLCLIIVATGFIFHRQYPDGVPHPSDWLGDLWQQIYSNLGIEVFSIAITVIVIERLNRREAERERKEELILQMGSPDNTFAIEAVRLLRQKGWGFGQNRSLQGAELNQANLQGTGLRHANLQEAHLNEANLQSTDLRQMNLGAADLGGANLQGADLRMANLQDAFLSGSNLQDAQLSRTNLRGAILRLATLRGARISGLGGHSLFDENTVLPDGSNWTPDRDLREFTDPDGWAAGRYTSHRLNDDEIPSNGENLQGVDLHAMDLHNAYLGKANLQGAGLSYANLQGADLTGANLQGAVLLSANLQGTNLVEANLQGADLSGTNLQGTNLVEANLQGARLFRTNLQGANLERANLQGAKNMDTAKFDESTILPDGTNWTPDRDMREFTDPDGWAAGKYKSDTP